ncbi:type II toxin-antitoxin system Phd/YefM family antitoxin [Breznakia pachnodae]|uniref:Antitoxin n=1 Tax=Breznakia pachnodae TaxID=265178 RepID=A0ABU0E860_9FIRM|nr:type II toxin-antitoxin system Phd/YefM family antitoxin [Breznakia pachnodae]MDQ0363011.1 antitoxin YefM [Breznakia pachnodae]
MITVNDSGLKKDMRHLMDKVTDDYEVIKVTRRNDRNVIIMSEKEYNNILENVYIRANKANYDWLMESLAQLEKI